MVVDMSAKKRNADDLISLKDKREGIREIVHSHMPDWIRHGYRMDKGTLFCFNIFLRWFFIFVKNIGK